MRQSLLPKTLTWKVGAPQILTQHPSFSEQRLTAFSGVTQISEEEGNEDNDSNKIPATWIAQKKKKEKGKIAAKTIKSVFMVDITMKPSRVNINTIKITTVIMRSLNDIVKCQTVFSFLHDTDGDICLLQECALPFMDNYAKFANRWTHGQSFWLGDNQNRVSGVGVLLNNIQKMLWMAGLQLIDGKEWE